MKRIRIAAVLISVLLLCTSVPAMATETNESETIENNVEGTFSTDEVSENDATTLTEDNVAVSDEESQSEMNNVVETDESDLAETDIAEDSISPEQNDLTEDAVLSVSADDTVNPGNESNEESEEPETVEADAYINESPSIAHGNHIYFYNIEGGAGSSDMILVESNGRWGLIDAGHRYDTSITDDKGNSWATNVSGLSCQKAGKNGRDAMIYMVETFGVDHLDFIIGTHAHSDHIGGIPEISDLTVSNGEEEAHSLIDESTVYIYKTYFHTGAQDDDIGGETIRYSWHNQAFYYQAKQAILRHDGKLVDVSCGIKTSEGKTISANQSNNLATLRATGHFSNVSYTARSNTNPFDDILSFQWGDMKFDLYHLFAVDGATNDNANSMVTVIKCNGHKVYLAGDLNAQFQTEQKIAKVVGNDQGRFDVVKMSHHGIYEGSNTKGLIDSLKPSVFISTNHWTNISSATVGGAYSSAKYYAKKNYGTVLYGVGVSDRMLGVDLDTSTVSISNVTGEGENVRLASGESCRDAGNIKDGWSKWTVEHFTNTYADWYYFVNNQPVTGWKQIEGKWYHFANDGLMDQGWYQEAGKYYYLNTYMLTGWKTVDGDWYYFNSNGVMRANTWAKDSKGWCWLGANGRITKSKWIKDKGEWYYLKSNGYMAANEWAKDSKGWCYMAGSGKITRSKWIKWKGEWYYEKANGYMAANEWAKDSQGWCYMAGSGKITRDKWIKWKGEWYYLKSNGYMAANEYATDSKYRYWMGSDGKIASKQTK